MTLRPRRSNPDISTYAAGNGHAEHALQKRKVKHRATGRVVFCPIGTCSARSCLPVHFVDTRLRPLSGLMNRKRRKTRNRNGALTTRWAFGRAAARSTKNIFMLSAHATPNKRKLIELRFSDTNKTVAHTITLAIQLKTPFIKLCPDN